MLSFDVNHSPSIPNTLTSQMASISEASAPGFIFCMDTYRPNKGLLQVIFTEAADGTTSS